MELPLCIRVGDNLGDETGLSSELSAASRSRARAKFETDKPPPSKPLRLSLVLVRSPSPPSFGATRLSMRGGISASPDVSALKGRYDSSLGVDDASGAGIGGRSRSSKVGRRFREYSAGWDGRLIRDSLVLSKLSRFPFLTGRVWDRCSVPEGSNAWLPSS